ncbi:MAG: GAF domain-containing protein, partial [Planctomycetia bacterium]
MSEAADEAQERPVRDEEIVAQLPVGIAVRAMRGRVVWANPVCIRWCRGGEVAGRPFFEALGVTTTAADEVRRLLAAIAAGEPAGGTLRSADGRFFDLHASSGFAGRVVVAVRDITNTILEQQKRAAIHAAGQKLADLSPAELADMTVDERIELLKSNILHYSRDLLQFDVVEIRLLDRQTGRLEPLLAEGMKPEAEARILYARPEHNGVTGYVAATGRSYWCSDTTKDALYLEGCQDAKSSLTVPLLLHDQVIGTFNVESPEPNKFTETDLQFLE